MPTVRKIFAICVIERTWGTLKHHIPKDQAAYQKGRNTTKQAMCLKLLIEKAIISENYNLIVMMIYMSKAFDTVNRKTHIDKLETILDESEMEIIYLLINNVKLKNESGKKFRRENSYKYWCNTRSLPFLSFVCIPPDSICGCNTWLTNMEKF